MLIQALRFAMQLYFFFILRGKKALLVLLVELIFSVRTLLTRDFSLSLPFSLYLFLLSSLPLSVLPPSLKDSRVWRGRTLQKTVFICNGWSNLLTKNFCLEALRQSKSVSCGGARRRDLRVVKHDLAFCISCLARKAFRGTRGRKWLWQPRVPTLVRSPLGVGLTRLRK